MGKARGDFTEVLIKKGTIGPDQIAEAKGLQQQTGMKLQDALVKLGYCTMEEVMKSIWPFYGVMLAVLMLVTYVPAISLWLPHMLGL